MWVEQQFVGSPQFTGTVDRYSTVDAQLSKNFEKINTTIKLELLIFLIINIIKYMVDL